MNFQSVSLTFTNSFHLLFTRSVKRASPLYWSARNVRKFSENGGDESDSEAKIVNVLEMSSPLKSSSGAENMWASDPYPTGTVFEDPKKNSYIYPRHSSIIMFPGQGNQFVGMAKNLIKYSVVQDMFSAASKILGYDLLKLCLEGPESKLNQTKYCQPALFVCCLAALEKLKDEKPWAINNCVATCGYSLGELAALVFAGCITFEKGVELVKLRAQAMQLSCEMTQGGMMTVLYGPGSDFEKALLDAKKHCQAIGIDNAICCVASYLFCGCKVVGGHTQALNYLIQNGSQYRLRKLSKLPVSGAFHTDLMKDAAMVFKEKVEKLDLKRPYIKIYSNVNGLPYKNEADVKKRLPKQIYLPVKWEQIMHKIYERPSGTEFPYTYECGPGNSLSSVLRKINAKASRNCFSVQL